MKDIRLKLLNTLSPEIRYVLNSKVRRAGYDIDSRAERLLQNKLINYVLSFDNNLCTQLRTNTRL